MNLIFKRLIYINAIFLTFTINYSYGFNMDILKNKPIFKVRYSSFGVSNYVFVNGFAIHKELSDNSQMSAEFPINHWMHPKQNSFGYYVFPSKQSGEFNLNSYLKVDLIVKSLIAPENELVIPIVDFHGADTVASRLSSKSVTPGAYSILNGNWVLDKNGKIKVGGNRVDGVPGVDGAIWLTRQLIIESSIPLWKFHESKNLPDYYAMDDAGYYKSLHDLFEVYSHIQTKLQAKDIDAVLDLCSERSAEIDAAFYLDKGETEAKLKKSFQDNLEDPGLSLAELKSDYLGITLETNEKLVSLTREGDTNAIAFGIDSGGSTSYPFVFRKDGDKWICAR